jgi:hypothetical protein
LTFWVKAEPATDLTAFGVFGSLSSLLATVATRFDVVSLFFVVMLKFSF